MNEDKLKILFRKSKRQVNDSWKENKSLWERIENNKNIKFKDYFIPFKMKLMLPAAILLLALFFSRGLLKNKYNELSPEVFNYYEASIDLEDDYYFTNGEIYIEDLFSNNEELAQANLYYSDQVFYFYEGFLLSAIF